MWASDYGIHKNDGISNVYIMSLMFYTNYDTLCSQFRMSFYNKTPPEEPDKISYYWFGSFLYITINYFGKKYRCWNLINL